MSLDACLDDSSSTRLIVSHPDDFDRVDQVRAECDAILVGANTIRKDNPKLCIRSKTRSQARMSAGRPPQPAKVTLTKSGRLHRDSQFFTEGPAPKYVYTSHLAETLRTELGDRATVVPLKETVSPTWLLEDLASRGIRRLLVEGGAEMLTWFLASDEVDELQVSIAPFFVGEADAVRVVTPARFPFSPQRRMPLRSVEQVGDMVVATYLLRKDND
jgi:5-amino-6-(5-phosphoribosylamino)uracil reductase